MNKNNCNKPLPEEFLIKWRGKPSADGVKPMFIEAVGTSLNSCQLRMLQDFNIPVVRPKGPERLKVFVFGSNSKLYSIIIARQDLNSLSKAFNEHGVSFPVSVRKSFGLGMNHF